MSDGTSSSCGRSNASATISYFTLKLRPYWPTDLLIWFAKVEAQFDTRVLKKLSMICCELLIS